MSDDAEEKAKEYTDAELEVISDVGRGLYQLAADKIASGVRPLLVAEGVMDMAALTLLGFEGSTVDDCLGAFKRSLDRASAIIADSDWLIIAKFDSEGKKVPL